MPDIVCVLLELSALSVSDFLNGIPALGQSMNLNASEIWVPYSAAD